MNRMKWAAPAVLLLLALGALMLVPRIDAPQSGRRITDEQVAALKYVDQFHARYNRGEYAALWGAAAPELQQKSGEQEFENLLIRLNRQYGAYQHILDERVLLKDEELVKVQVICITAYEQTETTEIFAFSGEGKNLRLLGVKVKEGRQDLREVEQNLK